MKKSVLVKRIRGHKGDIKVRIQGSLDSQSIFIPVSKRSVIAQWVHLGANDDTGIQFMNGTLSEDGDEASRNAAGDIDPDRY